MNTNVKIQTPILFGLSLAVGVLLMFWALTLVSDVLGGQVSANRINQACIAHQGVASVHDVTWSYVIDHSVSVICRDGTFVGLR